MPARKPGDCPPPKSPGLDALGMTAEIVAAVKTNCRPCTTAVTLALQRHSCVLNFRLSP